jgi:hypothetical protein
LAFSYWFDKPRFLTEGKLAAVLIIPSLGVPNWSVIYINTAPQSTSLSPSFLKVLFGTWHFDVLEAWWEFFEGRSSGGSSLFRRSTGVGIYFPFFWARLCYGLSKLVVSCGCYINIAGRKHVS